jgi:hypothetical protein
VCLHLHIVGIVGKECLEWVEVYTVFHVGPVCISRVLCPDMVDIDSRFAACGEYVGMRRIGDRVRLLD